MELPDFLEFEPFNELRERMGADKLGYFEVFDPKRHLTGEERAVLRTHGVKVTRSQVQFLGDHTLAYKNSRVGLFVDGVLHVTRCQALDNFTEGTAVSSHAAAQTTLNAESTTEDRAPQACEHCLHQLRFAGIDLDKERKVHHNKKILNEFRLEHFFDVYPDYPLYERTHVRHPF